MTKVLNCFFSVGKELRPKVGRTMLACAEERGIGDFAEGVACALRERGKRFWLLVGMAMCVKKPFANKRFGYFVATK